MTIPFDFYVRDVAIWCSLGGTLIASGVAIAMFRPPLSALAAWLTAGPLLLTFAFVGDGVACSGAEQL